MSELEKLQREMTATTGEHGQIILEMLRDYSETMAHNPVTSAETIRGMQLQIQHFKDAKSRFMNAKERDAKQNNKN